ncbi:hypothetical protein [Spirosoma pollinicola]|uniref:Uncharacterized protein n=1 Tax=Spirosoma pollinicola TaxID=2057025 RepID=A0A2K8Z9I9_9BACT|nr:hypothetical protein [Spirosoma pollinicola]AUD06509.1 hypothetical protein CWM47_34480 [Spirosoma pollinicola]
MDVVINEEEKFEKDFNKLSLKDRVVVGKKIDFIIELIRSGQNTSNHIFKLHKIHFPNNLDSSLYVLRINRDIRIILTSEKDPLFGEHILTLFRVVRHQDLDKTYSSLAESLYQSSFNKENKQDG